MFGQFFCLLYLMLSLIEIQCSPVPSPAIRLAINSGQDNMDLVRSHTVGCTLDASLAAMERVTALTLYGSKAYGNAGEFDPLATVDLWAPQARLLHGLDATDVAVFGRIGSGVVTESQLGISWKTPPGSCPSQYRCVANGLDRSGRVVTISITTDTALPRGRTTDLGNMDNRGVFDEPQVNSASTTVVENIETSFRNLSSKVDAIQETVDSLSGLIGHQSSVIQRNQQTILSELKRTKLASVLGRFDTSGVFNGKRYFASKAVATFNIQAADFHCQVMGGHLIEIEDKEEYDFVLAFLKSLDGANFFTGGNDIHEEGVWTYWHSGKPVTFGNWHPGQPNDHGSNEDCMEIRISFSASNDWHCDAKANFVCEAPA